MCMRGDRELTPYYQHAGITIYQGDALEVLRRLPDESVNCCVTSPPYWGLRDYGIAGQFGLEKTPEEYVAKMVAVFAEVRRVLRGDGTLWLNIGDSYWGGKGQSNYAFQERRESMSLEGDQHNITGMGETRPQDGKHLTIKPKDLVGIPWMLAFALRADGWYLRQDIIWAKPNPMPESVTDRCTKSHEYLFLLTKSARYYYDQEAIKEPAATDDMRRPYTSEGAWQLDGRAVEQRHGGQLHTAGNKTHKTVAEYDRSDSEEHRTAAGLLKIADTTYPLRNKRDVWTVATQPYREAHFATFPESLVEPCILAGCPAGGTALDPFGGSMTTMLVAQNLNCKAIAIELSAEYIEIGKRRLPQEVFDFTSVSADEKVS